LAAHLYLIRHGETDWNVEGRLQGHRDIPLNARGRWQARRCGEILHDLLKRNGGNPIDLTFVTSPLMRARETMELVRHALALDPALYDTEICLKELSFGDWEGFTYPELRLQHAAAIAARERDPWSHVVPNGESYGMLAERLRPWLAGMARDCVVVTHGGTMRALIALREAAPPAKAARTEIQQGVVYRLGRGTLARHD
jgi:probable phosphoglycerate mutase